MTGYEPIEKVPHWTPARLRHTAANVIRKEFGLDAAAVVLGHRDIDTSKIYSEKRREKYIEAAKKLV